MDSNYSVYYQTEEEDDSLIDLGLSLKALQQPEVYHPSGQEDYGDLIIWPEFNPPALKSSKMGNVTRDEGAYVKVNMDGEIVGRKICILHHDGYSTLALQLEDMFGGLFQAGSEFSLFYKDRNENWRTVGDVPWNEFVALVKRLRIVSVRKNEEALAPSSSSFA
ncbi:Iaa32p [Sarracenia purpurea var. burkii]